MTAERPLAQAASVVDLAGKVSAFIDAVRADATDGLTWVEFGELMIGLLRLVTQTLDATMSLTGPEKKELSMEAVAVFFDTFADRCVPLVAWPIWLLAKPAVRALVLALASGAIEQVLSLVRLSK